MNKQSRTRLVIIIVVSIFAGYLLGIQNTNNNPPKPSGNYSTPTAGSVQVLYSLDKKQNDKELISIIDNAHKYVYFAIYEFTLSDVADALVRAKERGVDVRGIVDRENSTVSYEAPIIKELTSAGINIETQTHPTGIMHIKALVTENAYASGSYNWTNSATNINDEVLEIGTDKNLRAIYGNIIRRLLKTNSGSAVQGNTAAQSAAVLPRNGTVDYTQAQKYIGKAISVQGPIVEVYTSRSGVTFFDYCVSYRSCPFSAVIFASDKSKFGSLTKYQGRTITVSGKLTQYKGRAEMVLSSPRQIHE